MVKSCAKAKQAVQGSLTGNGAKTMSHDGEESPLLSSFWTCKRCGCDKNRVCRIEVSVVRPNGQRTTLLEDKCDWSAGGLCTGCDERPLPEPKSLLGVWRQLGTIAVVYRAV